MTTPDDKHAIPPPAAKASQSGLSRRSLLRGAAATAALAPMAARSRDGTEGAVAGDAASESTKSTTAPVGQFCCPEVDETAQRAPHVAYESWNEPWAWRPADWPGESIAFNVVENQNPGAVIGYGNPNHVLFSYGGMTPGPTIRIRGDETLSVTLRNLLGTDVGTTYVGPFPDQNELTGYVGKKELCLSLAQQRSAAMGNKRFDFCLGEHTNGQHTIHSTNLHTHGLHVRPGRNPDGTHSDNVILRLIPQGDLVRREQVPDDDEVACRFLRAGGEINFLAADDQVGKADYEFRLGDVQGRPDQPHPPGTHWYHPHSHGSTADQVSSGMAGFLIVEGDVDDALRAHLVPDQDVGDPSLKAGPYDYRERLMFIQRVFNTPTDPDSPSESLVKAARAAADVVNGKAAPSTIHMRPNAIERWRVLNGSVDGKGFRRIMLLKGRFGTNSSGRLVFLDANGNPGDLVSRAEVEAAKVDIHQLAFDGVTLVSAEGHYFIKALKDQGDPDAPFPLAHFPAGPAATPKDFAKLADDYAACFADGDSLRNCYVRPNEVYLGPANRTDLLVSVAESGDYSVVALGVILHADTPMQGFQENVQAPCQTARDGRKARKKVTPPPGPGDVVVAWLKVTGEDAPGKDIQSLNGVLPDVPEYLLPINDDEPGLRAPNGSGFRTRTLTYSGLGANAMPLIRGSVDDPGANVTPTSKAFADFVRNDLAKPENQRLEGLRYVRRYPPDSDDHNDDYVLLPPSIRTMAIDGQKFDPNNPKRPRMMLNSAEEWVVYNASDTLWADTSEETPTRSQFGGHYDAVPLTFGEGMERFRANRGFQIVGRAVDHPFHMHQNPFWVLRIDVPAADGSLHNILPEPKWMDVVPIPRHRGRVVFRSRFPDFVGTYVNHCHILLHEDNGMMQTVEVTPFDQRPQGEPVEDGDVARANFVTRERLAVGGSSDDATDRTSELYPQPTLAEAYVRNLQFVDANHTTGQEYPGFEITAPRR